MKTNFIIWGNSEHEFSLNNQNPKSKRFYYNKRDFKTFEVPNEKIENIYCKDNCLLIIINGKIFKKGYFNWEIENFADENNKIFDYIKADNLVLQKMTEFDIEEKNFQVKKIEFGINHCLILSQEGNVYSWGDNYYGQLGINNQMIPMQKTPIKLNFPNSIKIQNLFAFKNNSFAIDIENNLWGWGKYEYIKQDNTRNIFSPMRIFPETKKIKNISFMDGRIIVEAEEPIRTQELNLAAANATNLSVTKNTSINAKKFAIIKMNKPDQEKKSQSGIDESENLMNEKKKLDEDKQEKSAAAENEVEQQQKPKSQMAKGVDIKANMEKELLVKFYDELKSTTKTIIDSIESVDNTILKNIQILTESNKMFLRDSQIEIFWMDFKKSIDFSSIQEKFAQFKSIKNQEIKMFEAFICYLLEIFIDEFKIDEYNLTNIYKKQSNELKAAFTILKKSQTIDSTITMSNNIMKLADYTMKYKKISFFIFKMSAHLYLFRSLKFKNIIAAYKKILEENDDIGMNIESKLTLLQSSFNIINVLLKSIDKSLGFTDKLKEQIKQSIIDNEEKQRELYIYDYIINSLLEIRELWEILMKITNEYLKLQIKNEQFAYYFEIQQKLHCIHRYVISIDIIPDNNLIKQLKNEGKRNKISQVWENYATKNAPVYLSELDGAIEKIDSILREELETKKLDYFSNQMNRNYANSIKDIALQKRINISLLLAVNSKIDNTD